MRTILLFILMSYAALPASQAQSLPYDGTEPTYILINDNIVGALVLTNEQREVLRSMELRHQADVQALLDRQDEMEEAEFNAQMLSLERTRRTEMRLILTPEQQAEWDMLERMAEERGDRRDGMPDKPHDQ